MLEAAAGGEINGVPASVEKPFIELPDGVLEDEIGNAVAIDIRDCDDPPAAEAAAVEIAGAVLEAAAGGEINGVPASVEKPLVDLPRGVLEDEIGDAIIVHVGTGDEAQAA